MSLLDCPLVLSWHRAPPLPSLLLPPRFCARARAHAHSHHCSRSAPSPPPPPSPSAQVCPCPRLPLLPPLHPQCSSDALAFGLHSHPPLSPLLFPVPMCAHPPHHPPPSARPHPPTPPPRPP